MPKPEGWVERPTRPRDDKRSGGRDDRRSGGRDDRRSGGRRDDRPRRDNNENKSED